MIRRPKPLGLKLELRRFGLFLAVGGLNTLVGYLIFVVLVLAGARPTAAVAGAWGLGIAFNFLTTGRIVFRSMRLQLLPRFITVYLAQLGTNILLLQLAVAAGIPLLAAQAPILVLLAILTFLALRFLVFGAAETA